MPMKQQRQKIYKTANGKAIDMELLRQRNELTPAVGNARVNARGDELGPGGRIIRTREEVLKEYYEASEGMPTEEPVVEKSVEVAITSQESTSQSHNKKKTSKTKDPLTITDEEWVEDMGGNFVRSNSK